MRTLTVVLLLILITVNAHAQPLPPSILWQQCIGGLALDNATQVFGNPDGSITVGAMVGSEGGEPKYYNGNYDVAILRLSATGSILRQQNYGGSGNDYLGQIISTDDGGLIFVGSTSSNDSGVVGNHGLSDGWVTRLDSSGHVLWQKCYGGSGDDGFGSVVKTGDSGFVIVGWAQSADGDVTGVHDTAEADLWVVRINRTGDILWEKAYGGRGYDAGYAIIATADQAFAITGVTSSRDGDVLGYHGGVFDAWCIKIDTLGNLLWQRCLGGKGTDLASSIIETSDKQLVVCGYSNSTDGDVLNNHTGANDDVWIFKLTGSGNVSWSKSLGGGSEDQGVGVFQTNDHNILVTGSTSSQADDVKGNHGNGDAWLVKLDSNANLLWQKCYGGYEPDGANSVFQIDDSEYVMVGNTQSHDGDVVGYKGKYADGWIVKLGRPEAGVPEMRDSHQLEILSCTATGTDMSVKYFLPQNVRVSLILSNELGVELKRWDQGMQEGGEHQLSCNIYGLPSGVYYCSISDGAISRIHSLSIVR